MMCLRCDVAGGVKCWHGFQSRLSCWSWVHTLKSVYSATIVGQ